MMFSIVEDRNRRPIEWTLRLHEDNGNYTGLGSLNSKDEADLVVSILNEAIGKKLPRAMQAISEYLR